MISKNRRWFQIHLMTTILLALSASVLLGFNIEPHNGTSVMLTQSDPPFNETRTNGMFIHWGTNTMTRGWPKPCYEYYTVGSKSYGWWNVTMAIQNAMSAIGILAAVGLLSEYLIRRRRTRRENHS